MRWSCMLFLKALCEGKYCRAWNVTAVNKERGKMKVAEETVWSWVII